MQGFLLLLVSVVTGPLYDAGYLRALVYGGTFLTILGMMITSICQTYGELLVAQGIIVGVGDGLLFLPSIVIVSQYFDKKRALATGIASMGSSIGTFCPHVPCMPFASWHWIWYSHVLTSRSQEESSTPSSSANCNPRWDSPGPPASSPSSCSPPPPSQSPSSNSASHQPLSEKYTTPPPSATPPTSSSASASSSASWASTSPSSTSNSTPRRSAAWAPVWPATSSPSSTRGPSSGACSRTGSRTESDR